MSAPQAPLVHMNGTSRDTLASVNTHARLCLREALEALGDAQPNARDYYLLGDAAWARAQSEHAARMTALRNVLAEMNALALAIAGDV